MTRSIAAVLFVALYVGTIGLVCLLNASTILRDAVVGVSLVAGLYMMFFLPTAAAGSAALALDGIEPKVRPALALGFAALLGVYLEALFLGSQSQHFGPAVMERGMAFIVAGNLALIGSYFTLGLFFARRGKSSHRAA